MEPFAFGQGDHGRAGGLKRGLVESDQACVAQEGFDAQGTTETGGAAGGEGVIGPGQVIPYGLWSPGPKKYGPGVAYVLGQMQRRSAVPSLVTILSDTGEDPVVRHEVR
jgi:hypothetical protein